MSSWQSCGRKRWLHKGGAGLVSDKRVKVGLVLPAGIDHEYSHGAYLGIERAVRELGIKGRVLTPAPREGYVPSISLLARQGYDLVVGVGFAEAPAVDAVAVRFPRIRFAIIDAARSALPHRPRNVHSVVFSDEQAGYLAGHLAGLVLTLSSGEAVISSIGGMRIPAVENYICGYEAGARSVNPDVTMLNAYTDDFFDPFRARSVALSQIARGSRVVFQVAGASGLGALEAVKEQGVWGIGVDVDQSHLGPHVLTSALKNMDVGVFDTIEKLVGGTLETGGASLFSLRERGVGLGQVSPKVPRRFVAEVDRVSGEIVTGTISITRRSGLRDQHPA